MSHFESQLLFLIVKYLQTNPKLLECADSLQTKLQSDELLGTIIGWDGSRRPASVVDMDRRFATLPSDQLLRLLKQHPPTTSSTTTSSTSSTPTTTTTITLPHGSHSILRRLSGIYHVWDENQRNDCINLSRRLSNLFSTLHSRIQALQYSRAKRAILLKSLEECQLSLGINNSNNTRRHGHNHDDSNDSETIDLIDSETDMPLILSEVGKTKEVIALEKAIQVQSQAVDSSQCEIATVSLTLADHGYTLNGLHRGYIDNGVDFLHTRMLGIVGRSCMSPSPLNLSFIPSAARMKSKIFNHFNKLYCISGHMLNPAYCSVFDCTGRYLLTGADDYLIKIWDVSKGLLVTTCKGHEHYISYIAVSSDNALFASGCTRGMIRIWRLSDGVCLQVLQHGASINWLKFDCCTSALASASDDGQCIVWDLTKLITKDRMRSPLIQQATMQKSLEVDTTTTSSYSRSSGLDDAIDLETNDLTDQGLFQWSRPSSASSLSSTIAPCSNMLSLIHFNESTVAYSDEPLKVLCLDVASTGRILVTGCEDGVARVWRFDHERLSQRYDIRDRRTSEAFQLQRNSMSPQQFARLERVLNHLLMRLEGHVCPVTDIQMNSLGDRVLTGSAQDGSVRIWSLSKDYNKSTHIILDVNEEDEEAVHIVSSRQRVRQAQSRSSSSIQVYNACWTADDLRVITVQSVPIAGKGPNEVLPTRLKVWDSMNGDLLHVIRNISDMPSKCLLRHPFDSSLVITAGEDGFINVWDIDMEQNLSQNRVLKDDGQPATIVDVSISADATFIAATDIIGRVTLLGLDDPLRYSDVYPEQYFSTDYAPFILDDLGFAIDVGTQIPVNNAPVGALCNINGIAYDVQPPVISGPEVLSITEVRNQLMKIENDRALLPKEMERVFLVFTRNKNRGREPRKFRGDSRGKEAGFPLTNENMPSKSRRGKVPKPRNTPQYLDFDVNQYQPSSEEDLDSDWENNASINEEEGTGHATRTTSRPSRRDNVHTLSDYRSLRRSSRTRQYINYDDGDVSRLNPNDRSHLGRRRNAASARAQRARSRANRRSVLDSSDEGEARFARSSEDEDDPEIWMASDEELSGANESDKEDDDDDDDDDQMGVSDSSGMPRTRSQQVSARGKRGGRKPTRRLGRRPRSNNDDTQNEASALVRQPKARRNGGGSVLRWTPGEVGCSVVPLETPIDREWLQWDSQSIHHYSPQLGDRVIYFPQGHKEHLQYYPMDVSPPWLSFQRKWPFVECEVRDIRYEFPNKQEHRNCKSVIAVLSLAVIRIPLKNIITTHGQYITDLVEPRSTRHSTNKEIVFQVVMRNCNLPEFLVPTPIYLKSIHQPWHQGIAVQVFYKEQDAETEEFRLNPYPAKVFKLSNCDADWQQSPWDALEVLFDDPQYNSLPTRVCPWEASPLSTSSDYGQQLAERFKIPCLEENEIDRIEKAIEEMMRSSDDRYSPFEFEVDSSVFPDYYFCIPVPVYIDLIRRRLRNKYYRQVESLDYDINLLFFNCQFFNSQDSAIVETAAELRDKLHDIVYRANSSSLKAFPPSQEQEEENHHLEDEDGLVESGNERAPRIMVRRGGRGRRSKTQTADQQSNNSFSYQTRSAMNTEEESNNQEDPVEAIEPTILRLRRKRTLSESSRSAPEEEEAEVDESIPKLRIVRGRSSNKRQAVGMEENIQSTRLTRGGNNGDEEFDSNLTLLISKSRKSTQSQQEKVEEEEEYENSSGGDGREECLESGSDHSFSSAEINSDDDDDDAEKGQVDSDGDIEEDSLKRSTRSSSQRQGKAMKRPPRTRAGRKQVTQSTRRTRRSSTASSDDDDHDDEENEEEADEEVESNSEGSDEDHEHLRRGRGRPKKQRGRQPKRQSTRKPATCQRDSDPVDTSSRRRSQRLLEVEKAEEEEVEEENHAAISSSRSTRRGRRSLALPIASSPQPDPPSSRRRHSSGAESLLHPRFRTHDPIPIPSPQDTAANPPTTRFGRVVRPTHSMIDDSPPRPARRSSSKQQHEQEDREEAPSSSVGRLSSSSTGGGRRLDPELKKAMLEMIAYAEQLDENMNIFATPVDPAEAPGYDEIVLNPMDRLTLSDNVRRREYQSLEEVADAILLMYDNCELYNEDDSAFAREARRQRRVFQKYRKELLNK